MHYPSHYPRRQHVISSAQLVASALILTACSTIANASEAELVSKSTSIASPHVPLDDFVVRTYPRGPSSAEVQQQCAALRATIQAEWLGDTLKEPWQPKCEVIVHASKSSYLRAVGPGGGQTSGSSLIQHRAGRIVKRQIDLLADVHGNLTALPHELTHVVLADFFDGELPPLWVDEGIAMLADSPAKQNLHLQDGMRALRQRTALRLADLMNREHLSPHEFPHFYGQSISLVRFFAERDEPAKLLPFVRYAKDHGYDQALQVFYEIDSLNDLEQQWHRFASQPRSATVAAGR